jgi:hypothetical protein
MTSNTTKNLSKRMAELEKYATSRQADPGLFDQAVLRWGPVPVDLLADIVAIPDRTAESPFISGDGLEVANRAARWIATGEQWRA